MPQARAAFGKPNSKGGPGQRQRRPPLGFNKKKGRKGSDDDDDDGDGGSGGDEEEDEEEEEDDAGDGGMDTSGDCVWIVADGETLWQRGLLWHGMSRVVFAQA